MKIRKMTDQDIQNVVLIQTKFFQGNEFYSANCLLEMLANPDMDLSVLVDQNKIIGYYISYLLKDHIDLLQIVIDRSYQKQGYGKRIIQILEQKHLPILVEVNEENENAISFYETIGFKKQTVLKHYYGCNDAILYKK
ncbi:MAG: GNAT family N-acetyltransferase [Mycoplasma sp.]